MRWYGLWALFFFSPALQAQQTHEMGKVTPYEFHTDLRVLPQFPLTGKVSRHAQRPVLRKDPDPAKFQQPIAPESPAAAPAGPLAPMPAPTQSFAGMSFGDSCSGGQCGAGWPPDTNGDVGPNHYIQAVNDAYAIYSKTGTLLASFTEDQLWSTSGVNPCNGDSQGDPVVLYDQLADRWILTHFAFPVDNTNTPISPYYQCVAASKTADPVSGGWWLYPLPMDPGGAGLPPEGALNDYAKFGIWPDCLYMAANEFAFPTGAFVGTSYASISRADLYSGAALTWSLGFISDTSDPFSMIPSSVLGSGAGNLPPAGTPNYFVSELQTDFFFSVRKFTAGPNCGGGGNLGAPVNVSQASYSIPGIDVRQPGTGTKLDTVDDRMMQKVRYRRIGAAESLWVVHNVETSIHSTARPQWAQINVTGGTVGTTLVQEQIYSPDTTLNRWMGSLAVDKDGNMALAYSTSNATAPNYPSIAYSGRLASDPVNTLPQTETQLIAGSGSQTNSCGGPCSRWGDYSAMSVDPSDDCTFWYTNEYYSSALNGSNGNWQTRIGSFKFPSCHPPFPVRIAETLTYFQTLQAALNAAVNGNTIQAQATDFAEFLTLSNPVSISLKGGYDSIFATNAGTTSVTGSITLSNGSTVVENIVVH
jgi:hypothetical protein